MNAVVNNKTKWHEAGNTALFPPDAGMAVKIGEKQIAVFNFAARDEWYASDNLCPHKKSNVLARGMLGDYKGEPKVVCPMHKINFLLKSGKSPGDSDCKIHVYPVKIEDGRVWIELIDNV